VTGYADTMVDKSVIMLSPEDIASLGVAEGDMVSVMRKVTLAEKVTKEATRAGEFVKEGATKAGKAVEEGAKDVAGKVVPKKGGKEL